MNPHIMKRIQQLERDLMALRIEATQPTPKTLGSVTPRQHVVIKHLAALTYYKPKQTIGHCSVGHSSELVASKIEALLKDNDMSILVDNDTRSIAVLSNYSEVK